MLDIVFRSHPFYILQLEERDNKEHISIVWIGLCLNLLQKKFMFIDAKNTQIVIVQLLGFQKFDYCTTSMILEFVFIVVLVTIIETDT